jgi:hypothetical protein
MQQAAGMAYCCGDERTLECHGAATLRSATRVLRHQHRRLHTALGDEALLNNIAGKSNTAVGADALWATNGNNNIALGTMGGPL